MVISHTSIKKAALLSLSRGDSAFPSRFRRAYTNFRRDTVPEVLRYVLRQEFAQG